MLFALTFAIICGGLVIAHSSRVGRVTLLDWAVLAMGGMYGLGWILVLQVTAAGGNLRWAEWILPFQHLYLVHTIASFLLLFGVLAGWYLSAPILRFRRSDPIKVTRPKYYRWTLSFWALLVLAVVTQGLYAHAYGGFFGQLEFSSMIRSALFNTAPSNVFSFLKPFGGLAMIAAFGFFGLWLSGRRKFLVLLGFLLSFLFSLYVLYSWLGRMGFMIFVATFPLALAVFRSRSSLRLIAWGCVSFVGLLGAAYGVSVWLNLKAADSLMAFLAKELSFPFGSFLAQLDLGENLGRGFYDFVLVPVYLAPSSWWAGWVELVGQVNTAVIMGAAKGTAGVTGAIPVDLLTLGLMQLHLPGVAITGLLFGAFLRGLQFILDGVPNRGVRSVFEANVALKIAVLGVFYAQPNLVVAGNIHWIAAALVIMVFLRFRILRVRDPLPLALKKSV
jgi:hypothetical protein